MQRVLLGADPGDGAAVASEPARGGDGVEAGVGRGRHPVPVHVPGAGVLGDEPALVGLGQSAPQLRGHRAEPVDGRAPVAGALHGLGHVRDERGPQRVEALDAGDARRRRHRGSGGQHVPFGHDVVAGDHVHRAVRAVGADREVHHGEAGAEHEDVADLGDPLCPRVGDESGVGRELGRGPVRAGAAAGGQHDGARLDPLAVGEVDDEPGAGPGDVDDLGAAAYEAGIAGELGRGRQQALDVATEDGARRELVRLEAGVVVVAQPPQEVLGVAGEGAHAGGGDVEEVALVGRRVGLAAPGGRCRVDQLDAEAGRQGGDQVGGDQRAAGSCPDHDDPTVALVRPHHRSPSSYCSELLD